MGKGTSTREQEGGSRPRLPPTPPPPAPRQCGSERRGRKGVVNSHVVGTSLGDRTLGELLDPWSGAWWGVPWDFTVQRVDGDDQGGSGGPNTAFKVEKPDALLTHRAAWCLEWPGGWLLSQ